jgi:hypothetical protein
MDIEKTMQFILEVQARLEASAQGHEERIAKLESSMATVTDLVGRLAQAEIRLAERTDGLAERMQAGFEELRGIQAETGYKLNALIDTVDKIVRRNGHKE